MTPIRVLICDAQYLFADALGTALATHDDLTVLTDHPRRGVDVIRAVPHRRAQVVLLDYWLPDMHAPAVIRELTQKPAPKTIILSWFHGPYEVQTALEAGAVGFLPKTVRVATVADAVRRAHHGEDPVYGEKVADLVDTLRARAAAVEETVDRFNSLTAREVEILQLLATGASVTSIARHVNISEATARTHVSRILAKVNAGSQLEAVTLARVAGLVH